MVRGLLSMQRVERGFDVERVRGINLLCEGWDFLDGAKRAEESATGVRVSFIEEIKSLAVGKPLMRWNRSLWGPRILHDSV